MWRPSSRDLSGSSYVRDMELKQTQCRNLVNKAERLRAVNGVPTKEEGMLYTQAADICEEIMNMNLSQRSVYTQWKQRMQMYDDQAAAIANALMPERVQQMSKQPEEQPEQPTPVKHTAPVKTAAPTENTGNDSEFQTKNACKDVPASVIEKWYKEQPRHGFEAVKGMEKLKQRLQDDMEYMGWNRIDEALKIKSVGSYLFYGPPGSGKTFLIEAFAKELMDRGFRYMKLVGGDIHASLVGVAEKTVKIAFREAMDNAPCIIFVDEQDGVCADRESPSASPSDKRLTNAFLEAWNDLREYGENVIFIGATNYPGQIDSACLDRTTLIRVPLPSAEERRSYFNAKFATFRIEDDELIDKMVEETENYSFRDLDRVTEAMSRAIRGVVIDRYEVKDAMGEVDKEQTDIAGRDALDSGEIPLTYALFAQKKEENPSSDKSRILASLDAFEKRSQSI